MDQGDKDFWDKSWWPTQEMSCPYCKAVYVQRYNPMCAGSGSIDRTCTECGKRYQMLTWFGPLPEGMWIEGLDAVFGPDLEGERITNRYDRSSPSLRR